MSDTIKSIADGDREALARLYEAMSKEIYVFLLTFCKDKYTAEDALQETFISIYESAKSYTIFNNPRAWIFTIAKNKAINIVKKDSRTVSIDDEMIEESNLENTIIDRMQLDALFSVLSDQDKKIVVLHAVYGFKHREIAEMLNLPPGTIMRRYKQSIDKMKKKDRESNGVFSELNKQKEVIASE